MNNLTEFTYSKHFWGINSVCCIYINTNEKFLDLRRHRGCDRMPLWYIKLDLLLPVPSVPIATKVVSLNPIHCEEYSIQHYVIKIVWFATGRWFCPGILVTSSNKTDRHDIAEILFESGVKYNKPSMSLWNMIG